MRCWKFDELWYLRVMTSSVIVRRTTGICIVLSKLPPAAMNLSSYSVHTKMFGIHKDNEDIYIYIYMSIHKYLFRSALHFHYAYHENNEDIYLNRHDILTISIWIYRIMKILICIGNIYQLYIERIKMILIWKGTIFNLYIEKIMETYMNRDYILTVHIHGILRTLI